MIKCPVNDITCPYNKRGECTLENAENECDEFGETYMGEVEIIRG